MATELNATQKPEAGGVAADNGKQVGALSNYVFQNPQDFLQTLKDNWAAIDASGKESVTKADFALFATESTDPKAKAAANIAVEHFDQLKTLPDLTVSEDQDKKGVTADDINFDMVLASGKLDATIKQQQDLYRNVALVEGGLAIGATALTVVGALTFDPLMTVLPGSGVLPLALATASDLLGWKEVGADIKKASSRSQSTLSSWSEINGAKAQADSQGSQQH